MSFTFKAGAINALFSLLVPTVWATSHLDAERHASGHDIVYVDAKAKGLGDGTSWANAFTDLDVALENRRGWEIWVAAGTYYPGRRSDSVTASFILADGVSLHGGFIGNEKALNQAKPNINPTILSGDIGKLGVDSDNVNTVVWADGENVLDGFVITGGYQRENGGGGLSAPGSIEVSRCIFRNNHSKSGSGAIMVSDASSDIHECIFDSNSGTHGGAINIVHGTVRIANCVFYKNTSSLWGGGALLQATKEAVISNSTFYLNSSPGGSGLAIVAAEDNLVSRAEIENSIFWKNSWNTSPDSNQSEIWIPQINKNNFVGVALKNCIVEGSFGKKSKSIRMQDTLKVHLEVSHVLDSNPLFKIEKDNAGMEGKDRIPFTSDDGLNLQAGSPAIDGGLAVPGLEPDILGRLRTMGISTDIGAYEN